MQHPLLPTLYDNPVVDMAYDRWDRAHVWLHKQPLFLWQIALSFKLFGVSEFTLRLPDIVLCTILVFISYRSGKLLVNQRVGYLAGVLIISSVFLVELVAGRQELEHNDISFLVYSSLGIWSFIEYYYSGKKYWIPLIGLFSGMAILCKWLVGLLIYFGWGVLRLIQKKYKLSENKDLFISLLVTCLIAIPWQILTFIWYPNEASVAMEYNALHFTTPIEGHGGTFWYHLNKFSVIYGAIAPFLIVPAFFFMYQKSKDKQLFYAMLSMVFIIYLFFSFAVTKMPSFTLVIAMIAYIAFAALLDRMFTYLNGYLSKESLRNTVFVLVIIVLVFFRFDMKSLEEKYTLHNGTNRYSSMLMYNKEVFTTLDVPKNSVLFNIKGRHYIEAMFYTGLPAYNFVPTQDQFIKLKAKGHIIVLFNTSEIDIPVYLQQDPGLIIVEDEIRGDN